MNLAHPFSAHDDHRLGYWIFLSQESLDKLISTLNSGEEKAKTGGRKLLAVKNAILEEWPHGVPKLPRKDQF
jgi:hypothetical protein